MVFKAQLWCLRNNLELIGFKEQKGFFFKAEVIFSETRHFYRSIKVIIYAGDDFIRSIYIIDT